MSTVHKRERVLTSLTEDSVKDGHNNITKEDGFQEVFHIIINLLLIVGMTTDYEGTDNNPLHQMGGDNKWSLI